MTELDFRCDVPLTPTQIAIALVLSSVGGAMVALLAWGVGELVRRISA